MFEQKNLQNNFLEISVYKVVIYNRDYFTTTLLTLLAMEV